MTDDFPSLDLKLDRDVGAAAYRGGVVGTSPQHVAALMLYRPGGSWFSRLGRSNGFAWIISIGLHGAVFAAFYLMVSRERPAPRRVIIPEARMVAGPITANPGGPAASPPLKMAQQQPVPVNLGAPQFKALPPAVAKLDGPAIVAVPAGESASGAPSVTSAVMASIGNGPQDGGGSGRGGAGGPVSTFFGQAGNAYKVVYVVDVSASLMIYIDEIVREMRQSVRDLLPTQRFHIVLAKPGEVEEFSPKRLVPAIGQYKTEAMSFIETINGVPKPGKADPVEAMKRAFAVTPELIYFMSDGDYPDVQDELERTLGQLNAKQDVKITVIGFDPSPKPRTLLERIARQHGGNFRVVEFKK